MFKSISILILSCLLACGGPETSTGYLALEIENSRLPAGLIPQGLDGVPSPTFPPEADQPLAEVKGGQGGFKASTILKAIQVDHFRITITGPGIETPIVAEAPASAAKIEILGIPAGEDRTILVEALNTQGEVVRRRNLEGISIRAGVVDPIKTSLHTIPQIFTPKAGGVVLSKNFHIQGFGEPGTSLIIEASSTKSNLSLNKSVDGFRTILSPSINTGLFEFIPTQYLKGKQTLTVTDEGTGESSSITAVVVDTARPGRQLVSAGTLGPIVTVGAPFGGAKEAHLPLVMEALNKSE